MESDTLEEIIEKSQLSNAPSDESAFHVANGITSVNKASSITNSDFYDIDNENLEFILNQEYEFNSNSKESKDCDDIFLIDDIADDTTSEIIPLNPDLSNFYKSEPNESNSHSNASSSGNPTETISEIIKDLIEKVDQTSAVTQAKPSHGNVSRITIQKITDIEPTTTTLPKLDTASTYESIIKDLRKSQNDKKSIELVPSLDPVKRSKPNILKKNRHSLPSNTKLKSMHISEILKLYGGSGPESDVKQESVQSEPSPIEASKIRIRQKVNIVLVKKTHVELVREYLDSNNNLIRQETLEEKNLKEVVESVNKEKVLPNKSAILPNIDELSSSSSLNLNQLGTIKNKKKDSAQKSYKLALSNRYRNQSPETPKQAKKRPVRAKHKLSQKPEFKSPQKVHNFSFSNIRFNLTPQERKKDLLELKSGIESEKETSSPSKESLVEETLVNRKIGHFLVEFGNEMQQMDVNDGHGKMRDCYVPINRLPESDYEYFNEKYKNDQKKPKSKFSIGDKVFVCCLENNLFLPAVVTDIQSKRKSQSSSFFNMSSSDIYYSYGCCLAFKSDQFKLTDQVIYENENSIIKHDWIKPQDSILVHSFRDSRYTNSTLINLTPTVNKETRISDFTVKQFRSRYNKAMPFQLVAFSQDEGEKILKRTLKEEINANTGKSPSKKFSYVNKVVNDAFTESDSDVSPKKRKSDDEY
ncbi:hypothetical protein BpHYR1_035339, partial [Brachionus plicatilis]